MSRAHKFLLLKLTGGLVLVLTTLTTLLTGSALAAVTVTNLYSKTNTPNSTLNLRSCASATCSVLRRIPHGTTLSLTGTSGDWFKTSYGGTVGYVSSWYVVLQGTPASTITRGNVNRRMVSYTFDAGADLGYTDNILNYLKSNNIKVSFGMSGKWAAANPTYVKRMAEEGHQVFNHSWGHPSFTGRSTGSGPISPARRTEELVTTNNKIISLTGKPATPYFRPPYGDYESGVLRDIGANKYSKNVMWSVDSYGWKGLAAQRICDRVVGAINSDSSTSDPNRKGNGYILLFHVGSQSQDANALPCITGKLKAKGFSFGTVPQVIAP